MLAKRAGTNTLKTLPKNTIAGVYFLWFNPKVWKALANP